MKKQVGVALCLAWAAVCCLAGSSQAIKFKYEKLGTLGGNQNYTGFTYKDAGINDAGQVVGYSYTAAGQKHAFVKFPGKAMQDLGLIPGSNESRATMPAVGFRPAGSINCRVWAEPKAWSSGSTMTAMSSAPPIQPPANMPR